MATKSATKKAPAKKAAKKAPARKAVASLPPRRPQTVEGTTPVSEWKKSNAPLELPSGKFMKIRDVGFQAFVKSGVIPNSLMSVVQSSIDRGVEPELDVKEMTENPEQLNDLLDMVDNVVCFVAISPEVYKVPKNQNDRDDELLYVDEVDDEDKMFIFGVCTGGTRDLEQFRREQADSLAPLQRS